MKVWHRFIIKGMLLLVLLGMGSNCYAQTIPEIKKIVSDNLLYPRDVRYTLDAVLPSDKVDRVKNAEWLSVARRLGEAGLIQVTNASGDTLLNGTEQSLDVVVPSMNLRYETTALNIVLGRWDIDIATITNVNGVKVVYGKRRVINRSRAYSLVISSIPPKEAAKYTDQDVVWEITKKGTSYEVVEKIK